MTAPVKKQEGRRVNKYIKRENNRPSSLRAPVERAIAHFVRCGPGAVPLLHTVGF
jgi:hypothetical protein